MLFKNWRAARARGKQTEVPPHRHPKLARRVVRLEERGDQLEIQVAELEEDLQEQRRLNLRVAELTDLVTELVGAAARGDDEFRRVLSRLDPQGGRPADQRHDD